ncbi:MAG: twin-arginine translocase TatA/TatE family subunit [Alphaproteobacteria bacterium]|nr:twin-arginine translocase TatA/TatE family subunit [Alphaproteobacteria bacterium]
MFDFGVGYTEMFVVALVAIIVIGPKDLPKVLRALGKTVTSTAR